MRNLITIRNTLEKLLPVLIMAVLALASFLLAKSSSRQSPPATETTATALDYYLNRFSYAQINEHGQLKSLFRGRYATHSLTTENTLVHDLLFSSSSKNNFYLGQAELANFDDDANRLTLRQKAAIELKPKTGFPDSIETKIISNHLVFHQYPERLLSLAPVQIISNQKKISSNAMEYDYDEQKIRLLGGVKIEIKSNGY